MATVQARMGATVSFSGLKGREVLLYVVQGSIAIGGVVAPSANLVRLTPGDSVEITVPEDAYVIFGHGDPIDEPIVSHGPFVMNTVSEIHQAYADYRAGRFGVPL
jgi:redox-sensitive bicupin YhaK (pirin superfamily)